MKNALRGVLGVLAGAAMLVACNPPSDIGNPCRLTRAADDGGVDFIPVGDSAIDPRFDFLANGDPDCENLVCVRQAGKDYSAQESGDNLARGLCSNSCIDATDCGDQSRGMVCQQLAFDQAFLDNLKNSDPATYQQYFGDSASSTYCIDPTLPDIAQ